MYILLIISGNLNCHCGVILTTYGHFKPFFFTIDHCYRYIIMKKLLVCHKLAGLTFPTKKLGIYNNQLLQRAIGSSAA